MKQNRRFTASVPQQGISFHAVNHKKNSFPFWPFFMAALFLGFVCQTYRLHCQVPKIALANMVIAAANSAPTNMGALICVSRH